MTATPPPTDRPRDARPGPRRFALPAAARRASPRTRAIALLAAAACTGLAHAHADDPKLRDRQPRWEGPTWTAERPGDGRARAGVAQAGSESFPAANTTVEAWLPVGAFSETAFAGSDCWGWAAPSGREYAIMTVTDAISFVEVTDPTTPTIVATVPARPSVWHDVKTFGSYAYAVSEGGGGIRVFDLSGLDAGSLVEAPAVLTGGIPETHNVAVDPIGARLYRAGGGPNGGLRIYGLGDPAAPAFLGQWTLKYVHDVDVRTYTEGPYAGRSIAFACAGFNGGSVETGLVILDVTDPADIVELATLEYEGAVYAHQCWLDEAGTTVYLGDEVDELQIGAPTLTRVIDVSDLAAPVELGTFGNGRESVDHNQYGRDGLIFQANYRTGLRIWDRSADRAAPFEVGFLDTYPEDDGIAFNGAWNVYPFLPSGTLIVSDVERGLFLVTFDPPTLQVTPVSPLPDTSVPSTGITVTVAVDELGDVPLAPSAVQLVVRDADGTETRTDATPASAGTFDVTLPGGDCGRTYAWWIEATDADGRLATFPLGAPSAGSTRDVTVFDDIAVAFEDDFELDLGWTAGAPEDTAFGGAWVRAAPDGSSPGEPDADASPDGTIAFVTGDDTDENPFDFVTGGFTTLVSPALDATIDANALLRWQWWLVGEPGASTLEVALSPDDGATWTVARLYEGTQFATGWSADSLRVADVVPLTATLRVRFRAAASSFAEAGVDDFGLVTLVCESAPCPADLDGDETVAFGDLLAVLAAWGPCPGCPADLDGNGAVDFSDLLTVLSAWGPCAP